MAHKVFGGYACNECGSVFATEDEANDHQHNDQLDRERRRQREAVYEQIGKVNATIRDANRKAARDERKRNK